MSVAAIVVAAGRGQRFGGAKQFSQIDGTTIAAMSVRAARSVASLVILVVPEGYDGNGEGADVVVTGGPTRASSVRAGLTHCGDADVIVIHDAARPTAGAALFQRVVDAINGGADAAIPGVPVTDTVKRVTVADNVTTVAETLPRDELVAVQTPQAFRRSVLEAAHASEGEASDDAGLVEAHGARVVVVEGEIGNSKITRQGDLDHMFVGRRVVS